jgi:hypothetical protein
VPSVIARPGHLLFAAVCIGLLSLGLVGLLMLNTAIGQGAFELQRLQVQSQQLADTQEALSQSLDSYRSPAALASRASALGMVPASEMAFIRLSDGRVLGEAKPAQAPVRPAPKPATTAKPTTTKPGTTPPATTTPAQPGTKPTTTKPATTKPPTKPATTKPATTKPGKAH